MQMMSHGHVMSTSAGRIAIRRMRNLASVIDWGRKKMSKRGFSRSLGFQPSVRRFPSCQRRARNFHLSQPIRLRRRKRGHTFKVISRVPVILPKNQTKKTQPRSDANKKKSRCGCADVAHGSHLIPIYVTSTADRGSLPRIQSTIHLASR